MAIIGIDLGTTNSLGAVYRNGNVELIPNRYGSFLTPSVVSIDEEKNILVGEIARERLISSPETAVSSFKKDMGYEKKYRLGKRTFSPEELSSFVIRAIVDDAREYLQEEIGEVVISVPAYFNDKQRVATKKAGALAGVKTNRIINEPSAAAMASYFDTSSEQVFLIFDFGGGTLDISIVECFDTMVEILSVAGDNRLGGDDFHEIMVKAFLREHGISSRNVTDKEYAVLKKQAEICKRKLTDEKKAYMSPIVPRNSVLPCSRVKRFYTIKDDQQKIELNILQGEQAYAEDNLHLDKLTIPVPKAKKGEESIDVRFTYDINGILAVDVTVVSTGKTVTKIVSQNISEADLNKKIKELEKLKVHPKQVAENQLIIERLRALYEEAPCYLRENILEFLREYEKILEGQDSRRIRKYSKFLNRVIEQYSFVDPFEEEFLFEEYDDEAEDESGEAEDEFDFFSVGNGGSKWTS